MFLSSPNSPYLDLERAEMPTHASSERAMQPLLQDEYSSPCRSFSPGGSEASTLKQSLPMKITTYRLMSAALICYGAVKSQKVLVGPGNANAAWLELVGGGLLITLPYCIGLLHTKNSSVCEWFFHRDYSIEAGYLILATLISSIVLQATILIWVVVVMILVWSIESVPSADNITTLLLSYNVAAVSMITIVLAGLCFMMLKVLASLCLRGLNSSFNSVWRRIPSSRMGTSTRKSCKQIFQWYIAQNQTFGSALIYTSLPMILGVYFSLFVFPLWMQVVIRMEHLLFGKNT